MKINFTCSKCKHEFVDIFDYENASETTKGFGSVTFICPNCSHKIELPYVKGHNLNDWFKAITDEVLNVKRPKVVTLCGSTKFAKEFQHYNLQETLNGNIVLSIGCNISDDELFKDLSEQEKDNIKQKLNELHLRKIDISDEILVLNIDGYIGRSTQDEIVYAVDNNKVVRFVEEEKGRPYVDYIKKYRDELYYGVCEF